MRRALVKALVIAVLLTVAVGVGAEEPELDPLLKLLVEQGVITFEQALAVQAEYDRRRAAESVSTIVPFIRSGLSGVLVLVMIKV